MGDAVSEQLLDHPGPWRFDELADLPEDNHRYEVVDGNLVVTPPPSQDHQLFSNRLSQALAAQAPPGGPYPVKPESFGLVVEVVSPRTRKTDRFTKPGEYAEAGIPLFWRVALEPEVQLFAFELVDGSYVPCEPSAPWGPVALDLATLVE
jgi:Uma2 family endonuclease